MTYIVSSGMQKPQLSQSINTEAADATSTQSAIFCHVILVAPRDGVILVCRDGTHVSASRVQTL